MKQFRIMETLYEDRVLDDSDDTTDTVVTGVISNSSSRSSLSIGDFENIVTDYPPHSIEKISIDRFKRRLSGWGLIVKKYNNTSNGTCTRRLYYLGRHLYISSLMSTREISIHEIEFTKASGKNLLIKTFNEGCIRLKMPNMSDALAFRNVIGLY